MFFVSLLPLKILSNIDLSMVIPPLVPDIISSLFLAEQRPGATVEPLLLAQSLFFICRNKKKLLSKLALATGRWSCLGGKGETDTDVDRDLLKE